MKYIQITKENIGAFKAVLDVDEMARIVNETDTFAFGAVEEEHNWGVGILSFSVLDDDTIVHRWIYVAEEFRNRGIAAEMMNKFNELVADLNVLKFLVVFLDNSKAQALISFYEHFGYHFERSDIHEMHVKLSELSENALFKSPNIPDSIVSLESISPSEIAYFMGIIPQKCREHSKLISIGASDKEISSVHYDQGKIGGALIVEHTPSGKLLPVLFQSLVQDGKSMIFLVRRTVQEAMKKYGPDVEVIINFEQAETRALIDKLFPKKELSGEWRGEHV